MISAVTGELRRVDEDRVHLRAGAMLLELLVPAIDVEELATRIGEELTFHTWFYLQGEATGGMSLPRLIGFLRDDDRRFFEKFITVKSIGPKTALRALTVPIAEIAQAIESKDPRFLQRLSGIGKRTAELMIAELSGKVAEFARVAFVGGGRSASIARRSPVEEDAVATLTALGERRTDAEHLLERAKSIHPDLKSTDQMVREMLRLRTSRV